MKQILKTILQYSTPLELYFLFGFFLSSFFTPFAISIGKHFGIMDAPKGDRGRSKVHKIPTPRTGGFAIFASFLIIFLFLHNYTKPFLGLLVGAMIIFTGMSLDDKFNLSVLQKFFIQFVAAGIVIIFGVRFNFITNPFTHKIIYLGWGGIFLTFIWIVGITNALNFIDGLDGLAAGIAAISLFTLSFVAIYKGDVTLALLLLSLSGALIAFLIYNFHPARIFLGDSGAELLGFILATISVIGAYKTATFFTMSVPLLTLGIPITEVITSIFRRVKREVSPFHYDTDHIHYKLLKKGWSQQKIAVFYYLLTTTLSIAGLYIAFAGVK
ncbi:MAG: undecaprenyl/decaprenyl-phosphate alpha-N-acetylglucosaminyl 1-phosphate transferase [Nitrospiraceae bacterium]|nr:undecaprenyl/decaprenyl-phosphate alpha-N-acetylglucosaminyl 1-phosphate transferase [Nitrospiraceae bacterium]